MKLLLSLTLLISILLSCKIEVTESNSEYLRENPPTVGNYCSFNPLDGECTYYNDNNSVLCSMGKCNEGDCITGKGVLTYPSGTTLETNFKKGSMEGTISLKECSYGITFVGILKNDSRIGKFTFSNGETYEGTMIKGKKEGKGILVDTAGNIFEGSWKNNIREGKFIIKYSDTKTKKIVTYIDGYDDEERERYRQFAIERKRREEAELAEARINSSTNLRWHKKFLACNVFSVHDHCDTNVPIIYKSNLVNEIGYRKICGKTLKYEKIYFQCQVRGYQRRALHDTAITIWNDEYGNCSPIIDDLCDR